MGKTCPIPPIERRQRYLPPSISTRFPKSSGQRRPVSTISEAAARSAGFRISTIWCSWAHRCRAIRSRAIAKNAAPTSCSETAFAKKPIALKIPMTIAGMSFGSLSGAAKEALGRGATAVGTITTTGDGGMTPEERGHSLNAGLSVSALTLRNESRRSAPRRRDRNRDRSGRQARRRRHAARTENLRTRRGNANPAGRHRSAISLPAPRLDGPRRSGNQDRGTARNHRLGEADLRQGRCEPPLLRHRAGRQGRGRRRS